MAAGGMADKPETLRDRQMFGWRVASDLPLPEWPAWSPEDTTEPNLFITLDTVPPAPAGATAVSRLVSHTPDGFRADVPGVAAALVAANGRRVVLDIRVGASPAAVRAMIGGPILTLSALARGWLPFRWSTVEVHGHTIALGGAAGSGASTLAAALVRRTGSLIADEVTILRTESEAALVASGAAEIKLWPDSVAALALSGAIVRSGQDDHRRGHRPPPRAALSVPSAGTRARRLDAVYLIQPHFPVGMVPLTWTDTTAHLAAGLRDHTLAAGLLGRQTLGTALATLASTVRVRTVGRGQGFADLDRAVAAVLVDQGVAADGR